MHSTDSLPADLTAITAAELADVVGGGSVYQDCLDYQRRVQTPFVRNVAGPAQAGHKLMTGLGISDKASAPGAAPPGSYVARAIAPVLHGMQVPAFDQAAGEAAEAVCKKAIPAGY